MAVMVFVVPLVAAVPLALSEVLSAAPWQALWQDPLLPRSLALSVRTALVSTALALLATMAIVAAIEGTPSWRRIGRWLAPMLAVPHAAFAIGLAWLVSPTGEIARLLALPLGWSAPPAWGTVHDPGAWLLTATLVLKELPFLLWSALALLSRPDVAARLRGERALALTLGCSARSLWWRVLWPLWLPRLAWPLLAVLAYSLTVVDLGLVIGPTSPPTLAVAAYADLIDGDAARNARGAAAALALGLAGALVVLAAVLLWLPLRRLWLRAATSGRRRASAPRRSGTGPGWRTLQALVALYAVVAITLALLSVATRWTFPALWPQRIGVDGWQRVLASAGTVGLTVALAVAAALLALLVTLAWLESTPPRWDRWALPVVLAPLVVPALLLMAGLYRGALHLQLDGRVGGLLWSHVLVVLPYVFIALQPAWRSFDPRFEATVLALGRSRLAFWWRIKAPLLAAPLASTLAIGFAVSVAQYLATQFIGAGRYATITTEAVTLASGGQRTLAAAFALLQALLPLTAFLLAARWGGRRDA